MKFILRLILTAAALFGITYLVPGITVDNYTTALIAAVIFGLVNVLIKPILLVITIPVNIITLGLFTLVINAGMFWLTAYLVKGFSVADFTSAFWGALAMMVAGWIIHRLVGDRD